MDFSHKTMVAIKNLISLSDLYHVHQNGFLNKFEVELGHTLTETRFILIWEFQELASALAM